MKLIFSLLMIFCLSSAAFASDKDKNKAAAEPVAWGQLTGISGCVIFKEGQKVSGDFQPTGINIITVRKLMLLEQQNYNIDGKEYLETPEVMKSLDERAQKDHILYVKIPEKYTPEQLEKARAKCEAGKNPAQ